MKVDVSINVQMPDQVQDDYKHRSLLEKCGDYMTHCESEEDSDYHWKYLKAIYKALSTRPKLNDMQVELLEKLEDFITKYDIDRTSLEGSQMFNQYGDE